MEIIRPFSASIKRYLIVGLLTVIPIWVTLMVVKLLLGVLYAAGRPIVIGLSTIVYFFSPALSEWLMQPWFQYAVALVLVVVGLYILGWATTKVIGRQVLNFFDNLVQGIPLIKTIYGAAKKFLEAIRQDKTNLQRVVLLDFPNKDMKAIGFITRLISDPSTGKILAAVYVPTTPNPTSGYIELVPLDKVISTDWTIDEAMTFIISGGAVSPDTINYERKS